MKKFTIVLVVLALTALFPLAASAEVPAPGGPFNTAFRVQNLSGSPANCVVDFYTAAGGSSATNTALPQIAVGDSAYVYVPSLGSLSPGQYSAVVSCDQEVAAVVNFSDSDSGASYDGFSQASIASTLYAPTAYNNYFGYYSNLVVQNTTNAANSVTLQIFQPGNTTPVFSDTKSIGANGSVSWDQKGNSALHTNVAYSAKLTASGGAIAAVVNIYGASGTAVAPQLYSYDAFSSGSTTAYAPVIMSNFFGYNTALVIQNMGSAAANVTITYGTGQTKTTTIQPGAADSRYTPGENLGNGILTGVKVESTNGQPIVVVVNESTNKNRAASYEGFTVGKTTVFAPIVMRRYAHYNTSITCQNVGTAAATMTISYGGKSGSNTSPSIATGATQLFYQPGDALLQDGYIGSAKITSAQPIVCVVNEDMNEAPQVNQSMDQLYAYDGVGQ